MTDVLTRFAFRSVVDGISEVVIGDLTFFVKDDDMMAVRAVLMDALKEGNVPLDVTLTMIEALGAQRAGPRTR